MSDRFDTKKEYSESDVFLILEHFNGLPYEERRRILYRVTWPGHEPNGRHVEKVKVYLKYWKAMHRALLQSSIVVESA